MEMENSFSEILSSSSNMLPDISLARIIDYRIPFSKQEKNRSVASPWAASSSTSSTSDDGPAMKGWNF